MPTAVKATDSAASTAPTAWCRHCGTERVGQQEDEGGFHQDWCGIRNAINAIQNPNPVEMLVSTSAPRMPTSQFLWAGTSTPTRTARVCDLTTGRYFLGHHDALGNRHGGRKTKCDDGDHRISVLVGIMPDNVLRPVKMPISQQQHDGGASPYGPYGAHDGGRSRCDSQLCAGTAG